MLVAMPVQRARHTVPVDVGLPSLVAVAAARFLKMGRIRLACPGGEDRVPIIVLAVLAAQTRQQVSPAVVVCAHLGARLPTRDGARQEEGDDDDDDGDDNDAPRRSVAAWISQGGDTCSHT